MRYRRGRRNTGAPLSDSKVTVQPPTRRQRTSRRNSVSNQIETERAYGVLLYILSYEISAWLPSILLCLLAVLSSTTFGQTTTTKGATVPPDVHQLFLDDQSDRMGDRTVAPYGADVNSRDAMRRVEAKLLLGAGKITTAQDFHDAAYIFQHGDAADDYLLAHILAVEAIVKGDASSKWISAATLDRYLQAIGKSQIFGTQYSDKSYLYIVQHKNDPSAMTKPEAHEKGMTQEPYDRNLVADPLRLDFCVPDLAKQRVNLKEFESGSYPAGIIPPGCTR